MEQLDNININITEDCCQQTVSALSRRLMGREPFIDGTDSTSNATRLLCVLLAQYGCITSEQFSLLFPDVSKGLPAFLSSKVGLLIAGPYKGRKSVYVLSQAGFRKAIAGLTDEYMDKHHIGKSLRTVAIKNLEHTVEINNLPYTILADSLFRPFIWHDRVRLTPSEELKTTINTITIDNTFNRNCRSKGHMLIPDGVLEFDDGYVFEEQDMGTETAIKLNTKHAFYGTYFATYPEYAKSSTVVYTVTAASKTSKSEVRTSSYASQLRQCKELMIIEKYTTLEQLLAKVSKALAAAETKIIERRYCKIMSLLSAYESTSDKAMGISTYKDLADFVDDTSADAGKDKAAAEDLVNINRCKNMRSGVDRLLASELPVTDFFICSIIEHGLSYVFISRNQLKMYARYVLIQQSGYADVIARAFSEHKGLSSCVKKTGAMKPNGSSVILKNTYRLSDADGSVLAIEEISSDYGGNMRALAFANECRDLTVPVYLLLLCNSDVAAEIFLSQITGHSSMKLRIMFINYAADPHAVFGISPGGKSVKYHFGKDVRADVFI